MPLDFTHEKYITPEHIASFKAIGTYPEMITLIYLHDMSPFTTREMKLSAINTRHIE